MTVERVTRSAEQTAAAACALAASLTPGDVVLLSGDLGAGKTAFVKGLALGLGIPADDVSSPTFSLLHEYTGGRLVLHHADLYRLSPEEVEDLGLDELAASGGILAVEWPDRLSRPWPDALHVTLTHTGETTRRITISGGRH
ncbi:MAG: tRNA (adenosine(37)-N6)-threonylcarbamoyltransferase complex ATPase subunit type 1 TsaE [Vicinamibacterales bacterium]